MLSRRHGTHSSVGRRGGALALAASILAGAGATSAFAGPEGEIVRYGDVTFIRQGDLTIIQASDGSIIDYLSFDILPGEIVRFMQPNELARVLNRITGGAPTMIQGKLLANGRVYFVNPAGIYFTNDAVVDVGGIYAAAGDITNSRFLNGVDRFTNLSGEVVNEGLIQGREVHLLGEHVANHGMIAAPQGVVTMVAGNEVYLKRQGDRITVKVDGRWLTDRDRPYAGSISPSLGGTPGVENTGTVLADGGQAIFGAGDMYALAIHNTGTVRAAGGEVALLASGGAIFNEGLVSASVENGQAGTVTVQGPSVVNAGTIEADSENGHAGSVEVTSHNHTYLLDGSRISASGGGGWATGGEILIHAYDGLTIFSGDSIVDVSGGLDGGAGGFAEVSGKELVFNGAVDLRGFNGSSNGWLLIDPRDIIIADVGTDDGLVNDGTIHFNEGGLLDDITISDEVLEAIVGDITLQADRDIRVEQQVDLVHGNNVTLEANRHVLLLRSINGAHHLLVLANSDGIDGGNVVVDAPIDVAGDLTLSGDVLQLDGGVLLAGGSMNLLGDAILGVNTFIGATDVLFGGTVDSDGVGVAGLSIDGDVTFADQVGGASQLAFLAVNGATRIDGGMIGTVGGQFYDGDVTLGDDTVLFGSDLVFYGRLDAASHGVQALKIEGDAIFHGEVGGLEALRRLTVTGDTRINGGLVRTTTTQRYVGDVTLGADTAMAGSKITFDGRVDGANAGVQDLKIEGQAVFNGKVGELAALRSLRVSEEAFLNGGLVRTTGDQTYVGDVLLGADAMLQAIGDGSIEFGGRVDGAFDLAAHAAEGDVFFGGNVGELEALGSLDVEAGRLILIDASLIRALGDIGFNASGRADIPTTATIVGLDGSLTIESLNGAFAMGQNEKFTVLGDLTINALSGAVTVGDLNTLGHMTINASEIYILTREGGFVLLPDGTLVPDGGVDFVAGGTINFSVMPILMGGGGATFATGAGVDGVSETLREFTIRTIEGLSIDDLLVDGTVLDLAVQPGETGPTAPPADPGDSPAEDEDGTVVTTDEGGLETPAIELRLLREPIARVDLASMGLVLRDLDPTRDVVHGLRVYNDAPRPGETGGPAVVSAHRLRAASLVLALERYRSLIYGETAGALPADRQDRTPEIRADIVAAWTAYVAATGDRTFAGFRRWLDEPTEADVDAARAHLAEVDRIVADLAVSGLTTPELNTVVRTVLRQVMPAGVEGLGTSATASLTPATADRG